MRLNFKRFKASKKRVKNRINSEFTGLCEDCQNLCIVNKKIGKYIAYLTYGLYP